VSRGRLRRAAGAAGAGSPVCPARRPVPPLPSSVGELQAALEAATAVPRRDQVLLRWGAPLDARSPLGAQGLVGAGGGGRGFADAVFLYARPDLRPDVPAPPDEPFEGEAPDPPAAPPFDPSATPRHTPLEQAALDAAASAALARASALNDAASASAAAAASHADAAAALAAAADGARASVEAHAAAVDSAWASFAGRYDGARVAAERALTDGAGVDLSGVPLHPAAATRLGLPPTSATLADVAPLAHPAASVAAAADAWVGLDARAAAAAAAADGLRADVEALFALGPPADAADASRDAEVAKDAADEAAAAVAALAAHLAAVRRGGDRAALRADAASAASAILPRAEAAAGTAREAARACTAARNAMARDVRSQVARVAAHQSATRRLRASLASLAGAADDAAAAAGDAAPSGRLPAAYRAALAEAVRRDAFADVFNAHAGAMAERLASLRAREADRRAAFRAGAERRLPSALLAGLGLGDPPPLATVTVTPGGPGAVPRVTLDDVRAVPLPPPSPGSGEAWAAPPAAAPPPPAAPEPPDLQNARLRAEVAALRAAEAARAAARPPRGGDAPPSPSAAARAYAASLAARDELAAGAAAALESARERAESYRVRVAELEAVLAGARVGEGGGDPEP